MQLLTPINVGRAPNDHSGDTLRDAMTIANENFAKARAGVEAVEVSTAAAQRKADAALPAAEKGAAGGVTPLDAAGKVPAAHLPPPAVPLSQKSAPGGVAPLDDDGRVPVDHLPIPVPSIPLAEKGQPNGVATLDVDGKVMPVQLPDLIPAVEKARPNGVATLASDGRIVPGQLPPLIPAADKGRPGGVPTLDAEGRVPAAQLPAVQDAVPLAEKGQAGGVATLGGDGKVPAGQLPPIPVGPPVGSVSWWPLRESIPAGQIPADGQTVSRATFPDLAAMLVAGKLPRVTEADWLADPLKRASYTLGDGNATLRLPDLNGRCAGSTGAVFLRGDGVRSLGTNGLMQMDVVGPHGHTTPVFAGAGSAANWASGGGAASATYTVNSGFGVGNETRPLNATGVWTIQAFGAVTNAGNVDAAQLASDLGVAQSALQELKGKVFGTGQQLRSRTTVLRTWYQNTTGRPILVGFHCVGIATGTIIVAGYLNGVSGNAGSVPCHYDTNPGGYAGMRCGFTMHVPPGMWWMADTINASVESGSIWEYA